MVFWASHELMRRPSTQLMTSQPFLMIKSRQYERPQLQRNCMKFRTEWTAVTPVEIDKLVGSAID